MTEQLMDYPPNIQAIKAKFPGAGGHGVIFAYAPYIYAPHHFEGIPPDLVAHEEVHIARQEAIGVERWWAAYLSNDTFRYVEELLAHRAEYRFICANGSRQVRRAALKVVAKKLAAPLYNSMMPLARCIADIEAESVEGCFACAGLGIALDKRGIECGKCEGIGYLEGEAA